MSGPEAPGNHSGGVSAPVAVVFATVGFFALLVAGFGLLSLATDAEVLPAAERAGLVSVGRYALRGVGHAEELFTIDPALL